jgi:hypothetical protein
MALFGSLDPQLALNVSPVLLSLMGGMLAASVVGLWLAWLGMRVRVS